jgi:hypothetical protein
MNKTLRITFISLMIFCGKTIAQKNDPKLFTGISFGPSFPVNKFGDKTFTFSPPDNNPSGLAKTGLSVNASFGYLINKSIGALLLLGGSFNKQDPAAFEDYLRQAYGNNIQTAVNTNTWKVFKIMAGGFYSISLPQSSKIMFQTKIVVGICKTAAPGHNWAIYDPGQMSAMSFRQSKTTLPWSFCYQLSAGMQYPVSRRVYLLLDISYFNSNTRLKYSYNPNFPSPGPQVRAKRKYNLGSVNALIGIGIKI